MSNETENLTFGGITLTPAEQNAWLVIGVAHDVGISPSFSDPALARFKEAAEALRERGLLYRVTGDLDPGDDPEFAGYAFSIKAGDHDKVGDLIRQARGIGYRDTLDSVGYPPPKLDEPAPVGRVKKVEVVIRTDGTFSYIHDDDYTAAIKDVATLTFSRASHVEPMPSGQWTADLSPVGGPTLGPFDRRDEALAAEVEWLKKNHLFCAPCRDNPGEA